MKGQPVDQALVVDLTEEPRLPVVRQVVVEQPQVARAARQDREAVSADRRTTHRHVPSAVDAHRDASRQVRVGRGVDALEANAREVQREVRAADDDEGGIEVGTARDAVGAGLDANGRGHGHSASEADGLRRRLLRCCRCRRDENQDDAGSGPTGPRRGTSRAGRRPASEARHPWRAAASRAARPNARMFGTVISSYSRDATTPLAPASYAASTAR